MEKYKKGIATEENGFLKLDTNVWMRPTTACNLLRKRGLKVSRSLMNYWINKGKLQSKEIKSLGNLTLVNIETIPKEMRVLISTNKFK